MSDFPHNVSIFCGCIFFGGKSYVCIDGGGMIGNPFDTIDKMFMGDIFLYIYIS